MSENPSPSSHSLSVDEYIALNDEIASLLKAGVPLDVGLSGYATSVSGRLSHVSMQVADGVRRGESLENAIDAAQTDMPVAYRAILEAGAASGRLPQALESLANHARRLKETRRQVTLALIYPTIVVMLAYGLFWLFVQMIVPQTLGDYRNAVDTQSEWMIATAKIQEVMRFLWPVPLVILFGFLIWIMLPSRGTSRQAMPDFRGLRWMPGVQTARRAWNLSTFTEMSSRLLQHGVPEPRALQLAAETTADGALIADVQTVSDAIQSGDTAGTRIDSAKTFPAFMKWMWKVAEQQSAVIPTFQQLADHYQRQAESRMMRIQLLFPIAVTVIVAGGVVMLYALAIFTPITELMFDITQETL